MKRLYWTQPDVGETEVEVVTVGPNQVTIEPILFHPEEGGQPADQGHVGEAVVNEVRVVDGQVVLTLDRPLTKGRYVARLDRQRRLHTATQHTAQHILSGLAATQFGLTTVGVHIGREGCTVDFDQKLEWDVAEELERRATAVVMLDIPVETTFQDQDTQVRSRLGQIESDVVRIVRIGDVDTSACCGAHVKTTGQIGIIRIFDLESKKQGTRASFLAGARALEQAQTETGVLRELRKMAGCASADLPAMFQKTTERSKELAKEVERIWSLRLADLVQSVEMVAVGPAQIGLYLGELPRELTAVLAGMIAEAIQGAGVVVSGTNVAISSRTLDAGGLLKKMQSVLGGKGGGSPKSANGRLDRPVTAGELLNILKQE
ncbi:MAG: alanyl-tRNA editing protein [Planctomycetes bacterium]|nr:alanyl-tRNA editing protein [Planctomycetota bacterium]